MKNLIYLIGLVMVIGCGKDEENVELTLLENETISGKVAYIDDIPCCKDLTVSIISLMTDTIYGDTIATVGIDEQGYYEFNNILPGQKNLFIALNTRESIYSAQDDTPEGDDYESGLWNQWIGVFLEENENDDGNNFIIQNQTCDESYISGKVFSIVGNDTNALKEPVTLNLYQTDNSGTLLNLIDSRNTIDNYTFIVDAVLSAIVVVEFADLTTLPIAMRLIDESPDNDPVSGLEINHLPVNVDSCETDADNNIYLFFDERKGSISGYALIDMDGDGVGDQGFSDQRIELYHRNEDGVPTTPQVGSINTASDGSFVFYDIPAGEYVLYFIGNGSSGYVITDSFDQDQELGEPDNPNLQFISVNLLSDESEDSNNIFLFEEAEGCNNNITIVPYCQPSVLCQEDFEVLLIVQNEVGEVVTLLDGHQFEWTDLVNGKVVSTSDVVPYIPNHPIQVDVTYSDGCLYTANYHRSCDQDFYGKFSLMVLTTGLGPTFEYTLGEIVWDLDPFARTCKIEHNILNNMFNPTLVPEGDYSYTLTDTQEGLEIELQNKSDNKIYNVGILGFEDGLIFLDDNIAADGPGRYFKKL